MLGAVQLIAQASYSYIAAMRVMQNAGQESGVA